MKIGIFDSGLGGLTVMKEIMTLLPEEDLIYFGDTARVPYGNKSAETIIRYSHEIADFLMQYDIKLLVIACNTASAHAMQSVQEQLPIPVIGVIHPGAAEAVRVSQTKKIAILATRSTIQSQAYQSAILNLCPHANVTPISCPLFVPLVEENFLDHEATKLIIREYLKPLTQDVDTILLGCTHYPLMKSRIQEEAGSVNLVDSATTCALQVKHLLTGKNLLSKNRSMEPMFFVTDDPDRFQHMMKQFLNLSTVDICSYAIPRSNFLAST